MQDLKNYTLSELEKFLRDKGYPSFSARQIFGWLYQRRVSNFDLMSDISKKERKFLGNNLIVSEFKLLKRYKSSDQTEKLLFELTDGSIIETVLIPQKSRNTLCLSSQVGCKFKCKFCASGAAGLKRNLFASEMVNQYLAVCDLISPLKITNIVFMGIGEPLDNFDNTIRAIRILIDSRGINFGGKRITLSTCGLVPEIEKLASLGLGLKLSISLHSADNLIRSQLMPINKKYPLEELIESVRKFSRLQKHPVTFEYVLISGRNTAESDAQKLQKLLKGIKTKINLISYNGRQNKIKTPSEQEINSFQHQLEKKGIFSTFRKSRGQDINAACGQLRATFALKK